MKYINLLVVSCVSGVPLARARLQTSLHIEPISSFVTSKRISVRDLRTFNIYSTKYFLYSRCNSITPGSHAETMLTTSCRISSLVRLVVPKLALEGAVGLLSVCVLASGESASRNRDFRGRIRMSGVRSKFFSPTG